MKIFFILFLYISLINSQIIDYEKLVPIYRFYDIQEKSHYYKYSPGWNRYEDNQALIQWHLNKIKFDYRILLHRILSETSHEKNAQHLMNPMKSCPQTNPINNSRSAMRLTISKSTHPPTNKKPHECGVGIVKEVTLFN